MRISVDVGGTFTDVIVMNNQNDTLRFYKVETTPDDPSDGVLRGFQKTGVRFEEFKYFIHGTTLGINALLTRTGAKVGIVTTKGFRDIYELGRLDRDEMYDLKYQKPPTLVPRYLRFEVEERVTFDGSIHVKFNEDDANDVASQIRDCGVESVAICFLHSYAYPEHEQKMAEIILDECPNIEVTLSSALSREYREYERTSTAVMDAYVKPITRRYLQGLNRSLKREQFTGNFLLTRSGGGAMTLNTAMEQPAHLILSGPAGGVIGARRFGDLIGVNNLVTIDMGGTSLDASLIAEGSMNVLNQQVFGTLPMMVPTIDIKTIGAGGGSIAWVDEGGLMQVGPQSAGAVPGPVCYGKGGELATVTDAALIAGYITESNFLGGDIALDRAPAEEAIDNLAIKLDMTTKEVATGIIQISEAKIVAAVREISIERGYHPKDFSLFAYGGGGGLIASQVARSLGIPRLIIPPGAANFSALGMLFVDVIHDFSQTYLQNLEDADLESIIDIYSTLLNKASIALSEDGFDKQLQTIQYYGDLRYEGQEHSVNIPISISDLKEEKVTTIIDTFNRIHLQSYGHKMDHPVEIVTLRVKGIGELPVPKLPIINKGNGDAEGAIRGDRTVYLYGANDAISYTIYERNALKYQDKFEGPAIIEESTSTTVVHEHDLVTVGEFGELVVEHAI
jgi:N-methylhydantoinase A